MSHSDPVKRLSEAAADAVGAAVATTASQGGLRKPDSEAGPGRVADRDSRVA